MSCSYGGGSPSKSITPATCMCAPPFSRWRNDASSPVSRPSAMARAYSTLPRVNPQELLLPWMDATLGDELRDVPLFDAHTHTGFNDPDGMKASLEELTEMLDTVDARAVFFTMHEPDGYREANDRVLAEAERSGGRLVPFCRVDPHGDAPGEARRALDAGARGIKLHPRAEQFTLDHPQVTELFAICEERGVPILI